MEATLQAKALLSRLKKAADDLRALRNKHTGKFNSRNLWYKTASQGQEHKSELIELDRLLKAQEEIADEFSYLLDS